MRRKRTAIVAALVAGMPCGCGRDAGQPPHPSVADRTAATLAGRRLPADPPAPTSAQLESTPPIVPLAVPGFPDAVVSVPIGATSPRPIVVATHGMWDFPEGLCDNWRWIVGNRAWVLCPRGDPMPDKTFRYRSGPSLASEIDAGVKALAARYPDYVDDGPMLYTGFSLGAILGAWIITHDPERYPRAVLIEGGEDRFSPAVASKYARGGGRRVLFACGLKARVASATQAARTLEHAGVGARVVLGKLLEKGEFIHWYNGPVAEETKAQLEWLFEGDARWR
jgi:pimeloyl-ACP methyl ester carboxylesterase